MRNAIMLSAAAATLLLGACGGKDERTVYSDAEGNRAVVTTDRANPDMGEVRISGKDGEMVVKTGTSAALPFGLQLMPGSQVVSSITASGTGGGQPGSGAMVSTTTGASPADAIAFYRKQIEAKGMAVENTVTMNNMTMIGGKAGDGGGFQVMALPGEGDQAGKTMVNIMAGQGG